MRSLRKEDQHCGVSRGKKGPDKEKANFFTGGRQYSISKPGKRGNSREGMRLQNTPSIRFTKK